MKAKPKPQTQEICHVKYPRSFQIKQIIQSHTAYSKTLTEKNTDHPNPLPSIRLYSGCSSVDMSFISKNF